MRIAIVCPGPSVTDTWDRSMAGQFDRVFAVSRAINLVDHADIWAVGDFHLFAAMMHVDRQPPSGQVIFSNAEGRTNAKYMGFRLINCEPWFPCPTDARRFTTPAFLNFVLTMWPEAQVDMFGCDMDGSNYYDDKDMYVAPTDVDERWEIERRQLWVVVNTTSAIVRLHRNKHMASQGTICR